MVWLIAKTGFQAIEFGKVCTKNKHSNTVNIIHNFKRELRVCFWSWRLCEVIGCISFTTLISMTVSELTGWWC